MSNLNHARPQLKLLDNFRQENARALRESKDTARVSPLKGEQHRPWEDVVPPARPKDDNELSAEHVLPLERLLDLDLKFLVARGMASPFLGKVSTKKKVALQEAEQNLTDGAVQFLRHCAAVAEKHSKMEPMSWLMNYCNAHLRNGNYTVEVMADVVFGPALEKFFLTSLQSDDEIDQNRLVAFVKVLKP